MSTYNFVDNLPTACDCYQASFSHCARLLGVQTNLINEQILFTFEFWNGKRFLYQTTTDGMGVAIINLNEFPPHIFNAYQGLVKLSGVVTGYGAAKTVWFLTDAARYPCLFIQPRYDVAVNTTPIEPYNLDLFEFVCCCTPVCKPKGCEEN